MEVAAFWTNVLRPLTVLKMPLVLTLRMALSVSVHLGSWVMEGPMEMAALKMSALPSPIVLKTPLASILLMALSVSVHLTSLEMEE